MAKTGPDRDRVNGVDGDPTFVSEMRTDHGMKAHRPSPSMPALGTVSEGRRQDEPSPPGRDRHRLRMSIRSQRIAAASVLGTAARLPALRIRRPPRAKAMPCMGPFVRSLDLQFQAARGDRALDVRVKPS